MLVNLFVCFFIDCFFFYFVSFIGKGLVLFYFGILYFVFVVWFLWGLEEGELSIMRESFKIKDNLK